VVQGTSDLFAFPMMRQERLEVSKNEVRETTFSVGTFANLSVEGDVTDGCKFLFFLDGEACCYSAKKTADILCDPFKQPDVCRDKDSFNVVEESGRCELHLPDFKFTDVGKYRTVFPGNLANNQDHIVSTNSLSSGETFLIFLTVLVVTLLVLIRLVFLSKTLWKRRHGGYEKRRERDTEIIEGLLDGNSETDKYVGNRNILRVRDIEGNTIFHHAAGVDKDKWTERSMEIVNNILRDRGTPLEQLESSFVTRTDIFRAKPKTHLDEIYSRIPDHTIFDKLKKHTSNTIDVNSVNNKGETPLHVACRKENKVNVKALLENDAKTDILDNANTSPVHIAVSRNMIDILKLLLPVGGS